jgi:hypothetical protein
LLPSLETFDYLYHFGVIAVFVVKPVALGLIALLARQGEILQVVGPAMVPGNNVLNRCRDKLPRLGNHDFGVTVNTLTHPGFLFPDGFETKCFILTNDVKD